MARILLGVTGGIAAYKACELVRLLVQAGHDVTPLPTPGAERFVTAETFEALARRRAPRDLYPHLVDADLLVIAPLSANTLAKLAHGLADNVLTQAALAFRGPVLAAPAMNARMWEHEATQTNAALLRARGVELIGPEAGGLAEGEEGVGRMCEPEEIAARCAELLSGRGLLSGHDSHHGSMLTREQGGTSALTGKRVLVTAGGTREPLDAVRFLGNRSSGRMGVALAAEALRRGAEVTLVAANLAVPPPPGAEVVAAPSAADLARETLARADADVVLMAAAVADYRPAAPLPAKRPKDRSPWQITLEPTEDVLLALAERRGNGRLLVGFAAEAGEQGLERARAKLAGKGVDLLVFNDVSRPDAGFDSPDSEVVLLRPGAERLVAKTSKERVAAEILDEVERLL